MKYYDRVRVACVPSGTGDVNCGLAPTGYLTPTDVGMSDQELTTILIVVAITGEFEVCEATYNLGADSFTRGDLLQSSTGSRVAFTGSNAGVIAIGWSGHRVFPTHGTLTATGTIQGDAATIITDECYITGGGADTGVILQDILTHAIGNGILVVNKTASDKILYPDSGSNLDGGTANVGTSLAPGQAMRLRRHDATTWYTS